MSGLDRPTQHLLRTLGPEVLAVLVRRYRDFAAAEDAVQEALIAAATQWPVSGLPDHPRAWLIHVAVRRITDQVRAETARRHREALVVSLIPPDEQFALAADEAANERDDTLELLFMCCHPSLTSASAIALTLRAIGGLTTQEIAKAFLVPEATMAQRLSRAKETIRSSSVGFSMPEDRGRALTQVMHVLYLMFSEGYTASSGPDLWRVDLSNEAIRVTRMLHRVMDEPEVAGLLSLMLLTDARRPARTAASGELVPLDEQDRSRWDGAMIREGVALLTATLPRGQLGPYQIQAAIAAVHDEAASDADTDWAQILGLYALLLRMSDNPMIALNHAIALAMVEGPRAGLARLDLIAGDARLMHHHRLHAVRGHLLERAGERDEAVAHYRRAAEMTTSTKEREYLILRAARLSEPA